MKKILIGILMAGLVTSVAHASSTVSWSSVLSINPAQSNMTVGFNIDAFGMNFSDSDSSPLSGTAYATGLYDLDTRQISQIQITSLNINTVNNLHFHDTAGFLDLIVLDGDANNLSVNMDASGASHPAGPVAVDASGNFSQGSSGLPAERNVLYGGGTLNYTISGLLNDSMDLGPASMGYFGDDESPIYFDANVVYDNSSLFTLSIPSINVDFPIDQSGMTGAGNMNGTLVATANDTIVIPFGDADLDTDVDADDLATWGANFTGTGGAGKLWASGDFDADGDVDADDLSTWGANYTGVGGGGSMTVDVPEPMTMSLLALGGVALVRRRK